MRLMSLALVASLAAFSDAALATPGHAAPVAADEERLLIEQAFERWIEAYERGDPDSVANLFTEDGIYAANTGEVLRGRDGIRTGVAAWMKGASRVGQQRKAAALDLQRQSLRFRRHGSTAHDLMRFTIAMNPPGCLVDAGHALAVWEKQGDGRWLIDALTVNQDKQPPANGLPPLAYCVQK